MTGRCETIPAGKKQGHGAKRRAPAAFFLDVCMQQALL
jgi:hypothetical protein